MTDNIYYTVYKQSVVVLFSKNPTECCVGWTLTPSKWNSAYTIETNNHTKNTTFRTRVKIHMWSRQ